MERANSQGDVLESINTQLMEVPGTKRYDSRVLGDDEFDF